jgi:hypothetical protein
LVFDARGHLSLQADGHAQVAVADRKRLIGAGRLHLPLIPWDSSLSGSGSNTTASLTLAVSFESRLTYETNILGSS